MENKETQTLDTQKAEAKPPVTLEDLGRALGFLSFSRAKISFKIKSDGVESKRVGFIEDLEKGSNLRATLEGGAPSRVGAAVTFSIKYANKIYSLDTSVLEVNGLHVVMGWPNASVASDRRRAKRTVLTEEDQSALEGAGRLISDEGEAQIKGLALENISDTGFAMRVSRSSTGLLLPGDRFKELSFKNKENVVFSGAGVVTRVESGQGKGEEHFLRFFVKTDSSFASSTKSNVVALNDERRSRSSRTVLSSETPVFIEASVLLFGKKNLKGRLLDLSQSGFSFSVEDQGVQLLPGMRLGIKFFSPKYSEINTVSVIRNVVQMVDKSGILRVSCEFSEMSNALYKYTSDIQQNQENSCLQDASEEDLEGMWEFFFETGFIYDDKRRQIQGLAHEILRTYQKLISTDSDVIKSIVAKSEEGDIRGHISTVRYFPNTWLIQHLNAKKGKGEGSAAQAVLKAVTHFYSDTSANRLNQTRYVMCYYRPDNGYPSLLFGNTKKLINDEKVCNIQNLQFCLLEDEQATTTSVGGHVTEATSSDLHAFEAHLLESGQVDLLKVENLRAEQMDLSKLGGKYRELGLYRERRCFVVKDKDGLIHGFSVCNYSSPGLNLSELTNSIRIFQVFPGSDQSGAMAQALAAAALKSFKDKQMPHPILLLPEGMPVPRPFSFSKTYTWWWLDIDSVSAFAKASMATLEHIREMLKKKVS